MVCESRGGRPGLSVPNSPYGLCGRKATLNLKLDLPIIHFIGPPLTEASDWAAKPSSSHCECELKLGIPSSVA